MRIQATCTLLAALLLAGCGSIDLPRGTRVYATTPVTDNDGNPITLGDQAAGDFMKAESATEQQRGLALRPGDVLYVRRWSAGNQDGNPLSPTHFIDRIPLRYVGAVARLTDAEEAFLLNLLVTNRQDNIQTFSNLPQAIRDREPAMWNALVDSLRLKRIGKAGGPFRFTASVDLPKILGTGFPEAAYFGSQQEVSIDGIGTPLLSAPHALTERQGSKKNDKYYITDETNESRLFSFISAELGGIDIRNLNSEESQWTLRELQESGVCRVNVYGHVNVEPQIAAIRVPASHKRFWVDKRLLQTHKVVRVLTPNERSRRLVPIGKFTWLATYVLPDEALDQLTVTDVSEIVWRTDYGFIDGPAHCQPRGGRR